MTTGTGEPWDTKYEWRAVLVLSIGFSLVGMDRFMIQPMFPVLMKELHLDYQDLGLISGILAVAWGVAAMFSGPIADRIGHRKVLIPSAIVFSLLVGLSGLATGLLSLLIIRAVMGVSEGAFTPASVVATLDASKPSRHGLNMGIQQNAVALIGLGLTPLIVTQLLLVLPSWRWVFVVISLPGFVVAYFMYRILRDTNAARAAAHSLTHDSSDHKWSDVFRYRNVPLNMCGMLCWMTVLNVLGAFLPSYLTERLRLPINEMAVVMSAIGFGGSLGNLVMPGLSDRVGRRPVMILNVIVGVACLLMLMRTGPQVGVLFALLFALMFCLFSNITLTVGPMTVEAVPARLMATASGIVIGTGEVVGGGLGPVIGGYVAKHFGIATTLPLATAGMALGLVVALAIRETAPVKRPGGRSSATAEVA